MGVPDNCTPPEPGNNVVPAIEKPVGFAVMNWWLLDADALREVVAKIPLPKVYAWLPITSPPVPRDTGVSEMVRAGDPIETAFPSTKVIPLPVDMLYPATFWSACDKWPASVAGVLTSATDVVIVASDAMLPADTPLF